MKERIIGFMREVKFIILIILTCFFTGSFVAFLPIIFNFLLDLIVGYNIDWNKYVTDYFLVIFSISVNTCICFLGFDKKISKHMRIIVVLLLIFFMIPSWEVYRMLFNDNIRSDIKDKLLSKESNLLVAAQIGIIIIIINYVITTIIGIMTEKMGKKKQQQLVEYEKTFNEYERTFNKLKEIVKEKDKLSDEKIKTIGTILEEVK